MFAPVAQRLRRRPRQGLQVGAGGVCLVGGDRAPREQRVSATDQDDPPRLAPLHDGGAEPVVGSERVQGGRRGQHLHRGGGGHPRLAVAVDDLAGGHLAHRDADARPDPLVTQGLVHDASYGVGVGRRVLRGRRDQFGLLRLGKGQAGRWWDGSGLLDGRRVVEAEPAWPEVEAPAGNGEQVHQDHEGRRAPAQTRSRRPLSRLGVACVTFGHRATLPTRLILPRCATLAKRFIAAESRGTSWSSTSW